jgi:hypothetical protein
MLYINTSEKLYLQKNNHPKHKNGLIHKRRGNIMNPVQGNSTIQYEDIEDPDDKEWLDMVIMKDEFYDVWTDSDE